MSIVCVSNRVFGAISLLQLFPLLNNNNICHSVCFSQVNHTCCYASESELCALTILIRLFKFLSFQTFINFLFVSFVTDISCRGASRGLCVCLHESNLSLWAPLSIWFHVNSDLFKLCTSSGVVENPHIWTQIMEKHTKSTKLHIIHTSSVWESETHGLIFLTCGLMCCLNKQYVHKSAY